ncbi:hypothetical protein Egran_04203 [Elaphomyces granulatus]|uniref:Uncharacterized protein n=1 Tax=Elaphomyces granulatus TaxID=519963 RepID=A0A232LVC8_9EURO|nr:hypothetical protein Egran_04203 [Elaphomyces granulatus]
MDVIEYFKLYLDPALLGRRIDLENFPIYQEENVQMWWEDYLKALYEHIAEHINTALREYGLGSRVIEVFRKIVKKAGFAEYENHSVHIKLTEAEAAAVYTAKNSNHQESVHQRSLDIGSASNPSSGGSSLKEGDVLLICDSGGGTTDISVVKVISVQRCKEYEDETEEVVETMLFEIIFAPQGIPVGSVSIDDSFKEVVESRLKLIQPEAVENLNIKAAVRDMNKRDFQSIKTRFGDDLETKLPERRLSLRVPGLDGRFSHERAGISNGRMNFTRTEIQQLFDKNLKEIFSFIGNQLSRIKSHERVTHFVISGGLGSSKYVQRRIVETYGPSQGIKILVSRDPQMAVCKGLVIDRVHELKYRTSLLKVRYCRFSYGVLFDDKKLLSRQAKEPSAIKNNKKRAAQRIHWLIIEGNPISQEESISQKISRPITAAEDGYIVWKDVIFMSRAPSGRLPGKSDEGDALQVCEIDSKLDSNTLAQHLNDADTNRTPPFWNRKFRKNVPTFEYEIFVFPAAVNLNFEVQFEGTVVGSGSIPVEWQLMDFGELQQNTDQPAAEAQESAT